jgi:D-alanyl-D-alanine carboxypeptidase
MNIPLIMAAMAVTSGPGLQQVLDRVRIDQEVPGVSVVVAQRDEILFAGASGVADLESGRAMTPDTVLYAGSLSKLFTVVLTLQLAEQDKLSLDDVVDGIADASRHDSIRVRHLLTHSSGLDREGNFNYWFNADFPDRTALGRYLHNTDLRARPGASVSYSNIGYAALGAIIEQASGQSYDDTLSSRMLLPLGMGASGSLNPGPELAAGYSPLNTVIPSEERPFAGLGRQVGKRRIREYHNANAMTPAFGVFSSARDLSRLARFLLGYGGNEVLSDDMRTEMMTLQAGGRGYGIRLGKYRGRSVARHGGWFAAHQSHLLLDIQSGISVVVMSNGDSASPGKIAEALLDGALDNKGGK